MDAYLEEELYDLITYCIQNPNASDFESKKHRIQEIGKELHTDGGVGAIENILFLIEFRIKKRLAKMQGCIVHGGMI